MIFSGSDYFFQGRLVPLLKKDGHCHIENCIFSRFLGWKSVFFSRFLG